MEPRIGELCCYCVLLSLLVLRVSCVKICEIRDERVYCQCDGYESDKVRTVSCIFLANVTGEDLIWTGFDDQRNVQSLSLNGRAGGALTTVPVRAFRSIRHVTEVMFTSNKLGVLRSNSFANLERLTRLDLEQNEVTGLEERTFFNLPNLTTLVLSENSIRVLPQDALQHIPSLRELFLDRNELERIADHAFQHLHGLEELDLNSNKISHITSKTFVGLRSLHRLDLSRNSLVSIKDRIFRSPSNLLDLDLSRNRISEITSHAFDGLKRLQKLNLKDNKLVNLQTTAFKGAPHLLQINLSENKLVTLQKHILDPLVNASNPEFVIFLKGNPFECRCDLLWISSFVNNSKINSERSGLKKELRLMKCTFADQRKAVPVSVTDLKKHEMTCPDPPIVKSPAAPVYHVPQHHHSNNNNFLQKMVPASTTTTSSSTEDPIFDELPPVQTSSPEGNRVEDIDDEEDDQLLTTVREPVPRATVKSSVNRMEPKNIELSDAAESVGSEPRPKTAEKKMAASANNPASSVHEILLWFLLLPMALLGSRLRA